jgi:hypothetical protein
VHILKGGVNIDGSPFALTCETGDYMTGVSCAYTRIGLVASLDYSYYFVAQDDHDNSAKSTPILDAPDVFITVYLPVGFKNAGPPVGTPILNEVDNPSGDYKYTVTWTDIEKAANYVLEEDTDVLFMNPTTVYDGPDHSASVSVMDVGTYFYRVKATNAFGESGWSNIVSVLVTIPRPPGPLPGYWSGITNRDKAVSFDVSLDSTQWMTFTLKAPWTGCETFGTKSYVIGGPGSILNNRLSYESTVFSFDGRFTSTTAASGNYQVDDVITVYVCSPLGCWYCYVFFEQWGTWTASYQP